MVPNFKNKFKNLQLGNAVKTFEEKAVNIDMPMGPGTAPMAPPPLPQTVSLPKKEKPVLQLKPQIQIQPDISKIDS